jgi:hypothetical protein
MIMNKQISSLLIKICILVGAFFLGLAARSHAQTTPPGGTPADTTHHRYGMHRGWNNRNDNYPMDHAFNRSRFHEGRNARDGRNGFGYARGGRDGSNGERIHYTPEQRPQVMAINKDYRQKAADLFRQDNITLKQYKAGLLSLQKEKKDKLGALLTQQQKDQLADQRKRMSDNRQVREAANLERLKLTLNLTDDQVAKLKSGQEVLHSQARAIHENENLLPQEKMQQMKALMAKRNDTYRSVLTPDQYSQFEKMFHHRSGGPSSELLRHAPPRSYSSLRSSRSPGRHFGGPGSDPGGPGGSAAI